MSKTEIKVFYGIHGGIVSGVYETLESCVESRGQYKAFDNFFDAHTFACTGKMPEDLKDTKDNTSLTESLKEKEDKKEDVTKEHDIKEGVAASLRQIADSLEKEQFEDDKLDEEIKILIDRLSYWKTENKSASEKMSRLQKLSVEIEDLISLMRQGLNLVPKNK